MVRDDDDAELTDAQLAELGPAREVLSPEFFELFNKRRAGERAPADPHQPSPIDAASRDQLAGRPRKP